jgi:hypothetical protein
MEPVGLEQARELPVAKDGVVVGVEQDTDIGLRFVQGSHENLCKMQLIREKKTVQQKELVRGFTTDRAIVYLLMICIYMIFCF